MAMPGLYLLGGARLEIEKLIRKEVLNLSPYEVECKVPRETSGELLKLDLNENLVVTKEFSKDLLFNVGQKVDLRLYPPPYSSHAKRSISNFFGLQECEIHVGNGADDVLNALLKVFVEKGSKVLIVEPTFSMYTYFTQLQGGKKITALLNPNFGLDADATLKKMNHETSMLILCSPNNPTGNQFKEVEIQKILEEFKGIVVVDEAYVDFAKYTIIDWIRKFDNLVVLRTFSKSFGLAGIRLGFLASNKSTVEYVTRVTPPFDVNVVTQQMIGLALQNWNFFKERIDYLLKEREWLRKTLATIDGITAYPSDANFILFRVDKGNLSSSIVKTRLERRNVLVKDRGDLPLLKNCIRVTVGTHHMNESFVSALRGVLDE